jgi:hypothetical protein
MNKLSSSGIKNGKDLIQLGSLDRACISVSYEGDRIYIGHLKLPPLPSKGLLSTWFETSGGTEEFHEECRGRPLDRVRGMEITWSAADLLVTSHPRGVWGETWLSIATSERDEVTYWGTAIGQECRVDDEGKNSAYVTSHLTL